MTSIAQIMFELNSVGLDSDHIVCDQFFFLALRYGYDAAIPYQMTRNYQGL
jgi:hypothetical protein